MKKNIGFFATNRFKRGRRFSNFFGGVITPARRYRDVENRLRKKKAELGFFKELMWQRVSGHWVEKYAQMMTEFFDVLGDGDAKVRVMFRENRYVPQGLGPEQRDTTYFRLYYALMILWQIKPDASKNDLEPKAADLYNRRNVRGA